MKFSTVMVIKAIVCLVFGLLLVLVPGTLLSILGITVGPGGIFIARLYGASLFIKFNRHIFEQLNRI